MIFQKRLSFLFPLVLSILLLIYLFFAGKELLFYYRLDGTTFCDQVRWQVQEKKGLFFLEGEYVFSVENKKFFGKTLLSAPFLNREMAIEELERVQGEKRRVYYWQKNPQKFSSLEKKFPFKRVFYALTISGVFLYFLYLKRRLFRLMKS